VDSLGSYPNPSIGSKYGWITGLPGFKLSVTVPRSKRGKAMLDEVDQMICHITPQKKNFWCSQNYANNCSVKFLLSAHLTSFLLDSVTKIPMVLLCRSSLSMSLLSNVVFAFQTCCHMDSMEWWFIMALLPWIAPAFAPHLSHSLDTPLCHTICKHIYGQQVLL